MRVAGRIVVVSGVIALMGPTAAAVASPAPLAAVGAMTAPASVTRPTPVQAPARQPVRAHKTARVCSSVTKPGHASCFAIVQTDTVQPAGVTPNGVSPNVAPAGLSPSQLSAAYKLDQTKGGGRTVAIVDAYDNPRAEADLAVYRAQYGLPACTTANGCFRKVNQSGSATSLPTADPGWAVEISLDLDMVSATCPICKILLVEAYDGSLTNLGTGVSTAARSAGVVAISNSYGTPTGMEVADAAFGSYYDHPGIAVTASTGDGGFVGASYPASSSYVTAVGGTTLATAPTTRGWSETAWSGAGSGCSLYNVALPAEGSFDTGCSTRALADVSAVADPNTGVAVYDSYQQTGWLQAGGTSASAPIIASVYALAGTPASSSLANTFPYSSASNLFDVTSGANGTACTVTTLCNARTGWDGPTGLGTPNGTAAFTRTPSSSLPYTRLAGADRYATAVAISAAGFPSQSSQQQFAVTVASGTNFPDALAAGPVAAAQDGPLLLVPSVGTLPATLSTELTRLDPRTVNVAGGTAAVSSDVADQLTRFGTGTILSRWAGQDRYGTAAQLAGITGGLAKTVFIATGSSFPDALGGSAAAGRLGGALLLTARTVLPPATAAALRSSTPSTVVVLGGEAVVGSEVMAAVHNLVPGATVQRWSGPDRYATAAAISAMSYPQGATTAYLASGANYPDALAGAPVAALAGAPLLLTTRDCVPVSVLAELTRLHATHIVVLGGTSSVSNAAANLTPCAG